MKVSIITVCFNSNNYISSAITSVLSQTYGDIEYIIVDGGSFDGTIDTIKKFDHFISKFVSEPDKGIYDAMNKGVDLASGDIICFLNSDDFYINNHVIEDVVNSFKSLKGSQILLYNVDHVAPSNIEKSIRLYSSFGFSQWQMRLGFMPAHPGTFVRRSVFDNIGNYKIDYKICGDFDWFVRAFCVYKLRYVKFNKSVIRMRVGGVSSSGFKSISISTKEQLRSLTENGIYSNYLLLCLRLPVKLFLKYINMLW